MPTKTSTKPQTPRAAKAKPPLTTDDRQSATYNGYKSKPEPATINRLQSEPGTASYKRSKIEPQFSGTQAILADMFGELLTKGGASRDVKGAVYAGLRHHARRVWEKLIVDDSGKLEAQITKWADERLQEWLDDLALARAQRPKLPAVARPEPKTVSERIRESVRTDVEDLFGRFVHWATPEDARLMLAVMEIWEGAHDNWLETPYKESALASGFAYALGENETYVKVPRRLVTHVESYVAALAGIGGEIPNVPQVQ